MMHRHVAIAMALIAVPASAQQPPVLQATRDLTIDAAAQHLTRVGWIGVAGDGTMIVTQPTDHALKYFGKDGALVASIGKEGEGNGEFSTMVQAGWLGDTLWVNDNRLKRVTFFSPQRKVIRVVPVTFDLMFPSGEPMPGMSLSVGGVTIGLAVLGAYSDGSFLLSTLLGANASTPAEWKRPARTGAAYLRVASNGVAKSLAAWAPASPTCSVLQQLCPRVLSAVAPNGSVVAFATGTTSGADSGQISVVVMDTKGDTVLSRKYPFTGVPVSQQYSDSLAGALKKLYDNRPAGAPAPPPIPAYQSTVFPPVTSLVIGRDGTIWVGQAVANGVKPWLALDEKGNAIGTVNLPANVTVRAADRGAIWGTERSSDPQGVENIVRYAIPRR